MNLAAFLVLLAVTAAWALVPLLPAIRELLAPTDIDPLRMVGRDNADVSRFARHFRDYMLGNLQRLPPDAAIGDYFGRLPDGTHFVRVSRLATVLDRGAVPDGSHDRVVILEQDITLQGAERFRLEVWGRGHLTGGPGAEYRAILGEHSVQLGPASVVWRWIHAADHLTVGDGCALFGRTSSDTAIRLGRDVGFERLGAPKVLVGDRADVAPPAMPGELVPCEVPAEAAVRGDHHRIDGDLTLPPHSVWRGNLVVTGTLRIGRGAVVQGSVKAHGDLEVEAGGMITGSAVGRRDIRLGTSGWIRGPVIAEQGIQLGVGSTVGGGDPLTTVSGRTVVLEAGVAVSGHVLASEGGRTEP